MQTKSYSRVLKWTFILGAMASLGSACVVTSGKGDDDDGDAGESGASTTAGKSSTTAGAGGKTTTAGTSSGGSGGTTSTAAGAGAGGEGGEPFMVGLCDADEPDPTKNILPTMFPSCAAKANDQNCAKCLKDKCCEAWANCYGSEPHIACGWNLTAADEDLGQWDCLQKCFVENKTGEATPDALLTTCSAACTNQCEADDGGNLLIATSDLIECANDAATCQEACFPFN